MIEMTKAQPPVDEKIVSCLRDLVREYGMRIVLNGLSDVAVEYIDNNMKMPWLRAYNLYIDKADIPTIVENLRADFL